MEIRQYIQDLFNYLDTYENVYPQFETEAFLQTYNGIIAVLQPLRQQRQEAVAVDQYLLERIQQAPLTSSDLRQLVLQILVTFFESEADTDGQTNQAYSYCRGLRAVKQDITFFEKHLLPLVCDGASLNSNAKLKMFLLAEIARYMGKFGRPLSPHIAPETFQGMPDHLKLLELTRRRRELGMNLMEDRTSLEFHLHRIDEFTRLSNKGKFYARLLDDYGYLRQADFWAKLKAIMSGVFGGIAGAFASSGYFRLVINQRKPAYLFYAIVIVLFVWLAVYVPIKWQNYEEQKLEQFQIRSQPNSQGSGR